MAFPLSNYIEIKNKYCLAYFGHCNDYIVELLLLRPSIEAALPGIEIHLCCKDRLFHLLKDEPNTVPESQIAELKWKFAYIKEITCELGSKHPIELLLLESEIPIIPVNNRFNNSSRCCVILSEGCLPTISLSDGQVKRICDYVTNKGFFAKINDSNWRDAGWVIGVEHEILFLAGSKGIRTSLVETGIGQRIYKSLFPQGEILPVKLFDGA